VRYYEDLEVGEERWSSGRTLMLDEMLDFARRYDPQYFHADPDAARKSVFGEVVASGVHTIAIWRQLDHEIAGDIAWVCGVAWDDVRFPKGVRAGTTLRAHSRCVSKRLSNSTPGRGVAVYDYRLVDERGDAVFLCRSTNLVQCRPAAGEAAPQDFQS
jgi:acyl dehydratase